MEYLIHLLIIIGIYSILSISLNLVVGFTGLLSVTHAAFFGFGAYATAILLTSFGLNFFLSVLIGVIIAMAVSFLIGLVLSKFKDDYYALASLGFNVIVFSIFLNWQSLTRGPLGIPGIKRPEIFGFVFKDNTHFLILVIIFVALIYFLSRYIINSSFGR